MPDGVNPAAGGYNGLRYNNQLWAVAAGNASVGWACGDSATWNATSGAATIIYVTTDAGVWVWVGVGG